MGPRLCGRGDDKIADLAIGYGSGASMGPRLCGRGDGKIAGKTDEKFGASMGPRLCGRGDTAHSSTLDRRSNSFNGAAPLWARRCPALARASILYIEASMGPRLCGRGDSAEATASAVWERLQWGRAFVGAEIGPGLDAQTSEPRLQWGRAFVGAEMPTGMHFCYTQAAASMGPRLCGRGDDN